MGYESVGRTQDEAQIWLAVMIKRRRDAQYEYVSFASARKVRREFVWLGKHFSNRIFGNMFNVAFTGSQLFHFRAINIKPHDFEADLAKTQYQRQAYISKADDGDRRSLASETLDDLRFQRHYLLIHTLLPPSADRRTAYSTPPKAFPSAKTTLDCLSMKHPLN
jgi:hypothetical protein